MRFFGCLKLKHTTSTFEVGIRVGNIVYIPMYIRTCSLGVHSIRYRDHGRVTEAGAGAGAEEAGAEAGGGTANTSPNGTRSLC